ncbi:MAG: helix-turn-helix domain-containing protein [Sulfuricellaceae bacterium]
MAHHNPSAIPDALKNFDSLPDSTQAQRARLHDALRIAPVSTIEARRNLDIMMPGTRIHELRHREGLNIVTHWSKEPTECGKLHRVARYVLQSEVA